MTRTIALIRVVSTPDGGTTFIDADIALTNSTTIGTLSERQPVKDIIFRHTDEEYDLDFHCAPCKQYILMLQGMYATHYSCAAVSSGRPVL
jgi:hypothetical protein